MFISMDMFSPSSPLWTFTGLFVNVPQRPWYQHILSQTHPVLCFPTGFPPAFLILVDSITIGLHHEHEPGHHHSFQHSPSPSSRHCQCYLLRNFPFHAHGRGLVYVFVIPHQGYFSGALTDHSASYLLSLQSIFHITP